MAPPWKSVVCLSAFEFPEHISETQGVFLSYCTHLFLFGGGGGMTFDTHLPTNMALFYLILLISGKP